MRTPNLHVFCGCSCTAITAQACLAASLVVSEEAGRFQGLRPRVVYWMCSNAMNVDIVDELVGPSLVWGIGLSGSVAGVAKGLLSAGLALGRAAAAARVPRAAARLRSILASGAALRLQFPAEDLGFVYGGPGAAVAPDAERARDASQPAARAPGAYGCSLAGMALVPRRALEPPS